MNAAEYNWRAIGHLWAIDDLPTDWVGTQLLAKADIDGDQELDEAEKALLDWHEFANAVTLFQSNTRGVRADGKLGPKTLEAVRRAFVKTPEGRDLLTLITPGAALYRPTHPMAPPASPLPKGRTWQERRITALWNLYGGAISRSAAAHDIPIEAALAVFAVESGRAYDTSTGLIIMRFENRTVWARVYNHRAIPNSHKSQDAEWGALKEAAAMNLDDALKSASWGLPQIMGFHHERMGYETPWAMVAAYHDNVNEQVAGFFQFVAAEGLADEIARHDWGRFVRRYNGSRPGSTIYRNYVGGIASAYAALDAMARRGHRLEG